MTRSLTGAAAACATVLVLAGAAAMPAHATYLGYGNGDPGNWDLWTEQAGGPEKFSAEEARERQWEASHLHHAHAKKHAHHMRKPRDYFGG